MDGVEDQSSSKPATEDKSEAPSASEDLTQGDAATSDSKQDNLEAPEDTKQEGVPSDSAMESSTATNTNEMKSDAEENNFLTSWNCPTKIFQAPKFKTFCI